MLANNRSPAAAAVVPAFPDVAVPTLAAVAATSLPSSSSSSSPLDHFLPTDGGLAIAQAAAAAKEGSVTDAITVTMTPTTTTTSLPTPHPDPGSPTAAAANQKPAECSLLGSFAILVQLALGALALMSLVYKRWRERPQRPVKIWFFDVSKQVFGSVLVHAANVFMSLLTSGRFSIEVDAEVVSTAAAAAGGGGGGAAGAVVRRALGVVLERVGAGGLPPGIFGRGDGGGEYVPNPCSFYLLNLGIDTTLGIPILIIIVRVLTRLVAYTPLGSPPESIQSGNYGTPPNAWWWLKQSFIYFCGLMGMKLFVLILFMTLPWLPHIGDWALRWTEGNEELQIVFVMMLFPLIMNALQYYIIDSYIKKQNTSAADDEAGAGGPVVYEELAVSETDDESSDDDEEEARKSRNGGAGSQLRLARRDSASGRTSRDVEYDPAVDGDSQTVIGSSSSGISGRGGVPKELLPAE